MSELFQHYEIAIIIPAIAALLVAAFHNKSNLREASSIIVGIILFLYISQLLNQYTSPITHTLLNITPGLSISFHLEPLGLVFSLLASG